MKPPRVLVATAPDGTELLKVTKTNYGWAGIALGRDGTWRLIEQGWSEPAVAKRTQAYFNRNDVIDTTVVPFCVQDAK